MSVRVSFDEARVDSGTGAKLTQAMRDEIAVMYDRPQRRRGPAIG